MNSKTKKPNKTSQEDPNKGADSESNILFGNNSLSLIINSFFDAV